MIILDKSNGDMIFGDIVLSSVFSVDELKNIKNTYTVKPGVVNGNYSSYHILDIEDNKYSISIYLYNSKVLFNSITLGSKFNNFNTEQAIHKLGTVLASIGGENNYPWGKVEFSIDTKGGVASILIKHQLSN